MTRSGVLGKGHLIRARSFIVQLALSQKYPRLEVVVLAVVGGWSTCKSCLVWSHWYHFITMWKFECGNPSELTACYWFILATLCAFYRPALLGSRPSVTVQPLSMTLACSTHFSITWVQGLGLSLISCANLGKTFIIPMLYGRSAICG